MGDCFREDFEWQEGFADTVRRIVGPFLLSPSTLDVDRTEATDFMVLDGRDVRVAARVRRQGYAERYGDDVTFRSMRENGIRTEWAKVIEDRFADWSFYGHHTGVEHMIYPFFLLDLGVLRELHAAHGDSILYRRHVPNGDGTRFHVIRPGDLVRTHGRRDLIIAWEHSGRADPQTELFDASRPTVNPCAW